MLKFLNLFWHDIKVSFEILTVKDLARPIFIMLWLLIVLSPLTRVDRRDPIAGSVYVLFCVASGVALVWALPQTFIADRPTIDTIFSSMLLMAGISGFRWFYRSQQFELPKSIDERLKKEKHKTKKEK